MTWLALLTNKYVAMFGAAVILCAGMFFFGAHWQSKRDAPKLIAAQVAAQSAVSANATNQATIANLKAANARWAASAASSATRAAESVQSLTEQQKALRMQYDALQAKLARTVNEHGDAHAWACVPIPPSVLAALGLHPESTGCQIGAGNGERSSDPEGSSGTHAAGAGA